MPLDKTVNIPPTEPAIEVPTLSPSAAPAKDVSSLPDKTRVTAIVSPSTSLSIPEPLSMNNMVESGVFSPVVRASFSATGASLTPSMVIFTVAVSTPPFPSEMV